MKVLTTLVNATERRRVWKGLEDDDFETAGAAFRAMRAAYGRCASKMYNEPADGSPDFHCGWVFNKRARYTDCNDYYTQEAWCRLVDVRPAVVRSVNLDGARAGGVSRHHGGS